MKARELFTTIGTEGGLLPADLLQRLVHRDKELPGLDDASYHLVPGERLNERISQSWNRLLGAWKVFRATAAALPESDTGTTLTRERWLLILFQELGYGRLPTARASEIDGKSYAISHFWHHSPIHLVSYRLDLDNRTPGVAGAARTSPHGLVQEFLNRSNDHLWGFVSNGLHLRMVRDSVSLTRQAYVEFDLEGMLDGEVYADFVLLWLLCHQSRVEAEKPVECWLERWTRVAQEQGTRALDRLRGGVEQAIKAMGRGFLAYPTNAALKEKLRSGALSSQDCYRQLLRLVYRLLFLFVAEDRDLLSDPNAAPEVRERYSRYYSTARLRRLAERQRGTKHIDVYRGLRIVMEKLGSDEGCPSLALPALGSFLWTENAMPALLHCDITNHDLLEAVRALALTLDNQVWRSVDYKNLGSEELGSLYESLLELHPDLNIDAATFDLSTTGGHERKTTGSYYTHASLIQCLLHSALDPVLDEAARRPNAQEAILSLKVCDPACGSGHFLIAAAHRIARRLAATRTGDEEPSPKAMHRALRDVIGHCVYGVDANPMAVELCKVSLWMESLEPGKPLTFLDHHIQCGNSLLGTTPALLAQGIPDEAFQPIEGDDKAVATALRKRNRVERAGQTTFAIAESSASYSSLSDRVANLDRIDDSSITGLHDKEERYTRLAESLEYRKARLVADAWCAPFVWKKARDAPEPVTHDIFCRLQTEPERVSAATRAEIARLAERYRFFHWHVAFPEVFRVPTDGEDPQNEQTGWSGGFDVVLGNPPWEKFTISEEEWFASREPTVASTRGKDRRGKLIAALAKSDPDLFQAWQEALRDAEAHAFILSRKSGLYPLTGSGELNTYHLFAERAQQTVAPDGRVGIIVKTGISSADNCLAFFKKLTGNRQLVSLFDFVNTRGLFPSVQTVERFSLITFTGTRGGNDTITFATLCQDVSDLAQPDRQYTLSPADVALMSPLNGAAPLLKGARDAGIMRRLYREFPILGMRDTARPEEYWNVQYTRIFDMAIDSKHFRRREELELQGLVITSQRRFVAKDEEYWPLYEGKYIYLMEHRYGSFEKVPESKRYGRKATAPTPRTVQLQDASYEIVPRYWFPRSLWLERCRTKKLRSDYQFHFRDVAGVYPDLRTAIGAICPAGPAGHKTPALVLPPVGDDQNDAKRYLAFAALFCSIPFDYIVRNKLFSKSLTVNTLSQIPMPSPRCVVARDGNESPLQAHLQRLAIELSFTSWALLPLGRAVGKMTPFVWDAERRFLMLREVDAIAAHLYGLSREELEYVLSTFVTLQRHDAAKYGDYRTKLMILECYDRMQRAIDTGEPYQTLLDPPPADPRVAHPPRTEG